MCATGCLLSPQVVGRLAGQVAKLLQGKHKPSYVPHVDCGDYVVITNASKVKFTGRKLKQKLYRWHTGFPGGLKARPAWMQLQRNPVKLVRDTVTGMLPKNNLRKHGWMKKLRVYEGEEHPHVDAVAACDASAAYLAHCAPSSKKLLVDKQPIPFVTDVAVPEEAEEEGDVIPPAILEGIFHFRLRETLDAEVAFWAEKGEARVPARTLELHGLTQGEDGAFAFADSGAPVPGAEEVAHFGAILDVLESAEDEAAVDALYTALHAGEDITAPASGAGGRR